jgi:thioredoxin 1
MKRSNTLLEVSPLRNPIVLLATLLLLSAAGPTLAENPKAPLSTPALKNAIASGKLNTIVFFQNPAGMPCKAQNELLQKLHRDRKQNFNIVYVSVARPEDQKAFYDYGIRSLPSLVLVDRGGRVDRVFPPGIQSAETLAAALDRLK